MEKLRTDFSTVSMDRAMDDPRSEGEDGLFSAGNSAIHLPDLSAMPDLSTTSSYALDLNASTQAAYGLPSPDRMTFWSKNGKLKNAPVSIATDGAISIMQNTLEQHAAFRARQTRDMEIELERSLDAQRLAQVTEMFRRSMSGSKTLTSDGTSFSEATGSYVEEQNKSLKTSFRAKSAAAGSRG